MTEAARPRGAARVVVPILAAFLMLLAILAMFAIFGFSGMCGAMADRDRADCDSDVTGAYVRGGLSIAFAIGAIVAAARAKTAEIAWGVGLSLLVGAVVVSPLLAFFGL